MIVYRSFLGASRQYAAWLHAQVPSDIMPAKQADGKALDACDTLVLFCGIYATRLSLAGYLERHWPQLAGKRVVLVTVGTTPETSALNAAEVNQGKIQPIADYLKAA